MDDGDYWMYVYKSRHDWSVCPYAHRGERAARRCPQAFSYSAEPCPEYSKKGSCPAGDACPMAHSVFESWLHPSRFRTQLCCFGASCRRRICFFAHSVSQMRVAPVVASPAGGAVMRRTQAVVPASVITSAETSVAAAAAAAGAAAGVFPAGQASLPAQMTAAVPCMPTSVMPGWVLTSQGWAAGCVDPTAAAPLPAEPAGASLSMQPMIAPGMAVSVARPPSAAVAAVAAADVSGLASSLGHLVLQPNQLPAASPGQLLPAPQVVLHGSTAYLAQTSMAASSSVPRSFGVSSSDQLENELCLPSGPVVNSASGSMVGYSSNSGSGTAFMHGGQAHELPYYPQPRHGPQGW